MKALHHPAKETKGDGERSVQGGSGGHRAGACAADGNVRASPWKALTDAN